MLPTSFAINVYSLPSILKMTYHAKNTAAITSLFQTNNHIKPSLLYYFITVLIMWRGKASQREQYRRVYMGHYVFNQGTLPIKARMKLNLTHNAPAATPPMTVKVHYISLHYTVAQCSWDEHHKCEQMLLIFGFYAKFIARPKILCSALKCDVSNQDNNN